MKRYCFVRITDKRFIVDVINRRIINSINRSIDHTTESYRVNSLIFYIVEHGNFCGFSKSDIDITFSDNIEDLFIDML